MENLMIGQIFTANVGYSMTLPTFYVVKSVTPKTCVLHRIKSYLSVNSDGYGQQGYKMPVIPYCDDDFCRKSDVRMMIRENHLYNKKERLYATLWDGKPQWYDSLD